MTSYGLWSYEIVAIEEDRIVVHEIWRPTPGGPAVLNDDPPPDIYEKTVYRPLPKRHLPNN